MQFNLSSKHTLLLVLYLIVYLSAISFGFGFNHELWVDEGHFYKTIKLFTVDFSVETLRTYNEVISPLTFIIYALWAKIFGADLAILRVFSLLVAFVTYCRFYQLLQYHFNGQWALLLTIFLSLNPYMIGVSFFCYTDMLTVLLSIEIALAIISTSVFRLLIFSILALYARQYNITVLIAVGLYYLLIKNEMGQINWKNAFLMFVPLLAFLPLAILWKGLAPDSEMHSLLNNYSYHYQLIALTTYAYTVCIYCTPFSTIWLFRNYTFQFKELLFVTALTSVFYYFYPVTAAACSIHDGSYTVGLFHKVLVMVFKNNYVVHLVLFLAVLVAVITLVQLTKKIIPYLLVYKPDSIKLFYLLNVMTLFLVLPFSYQIWEKYVLNILPFCLILFAQVFEKEKVD